MPDRISHVAVAIPAYEEEGLGGFLSELDKALVSCAERVTFHVVDDASPSDMVRAVERLDAHLSGTLDVTVNPVNRGHGPTVLAAYHRALLMDPDVVVQVDGDGQFFGEDATVLIEAVRSGADVAVGVRTEREDPWYRRLLSLGLRRYLQVLARVRSADPNCPFRAFRSDALSALLREIPESALIPSVYLTVLASLRGLAVRELPVRHRVRRGNSQQGTMWGARRSLLIPRRLITFAGRAFIESVQLRNTLSRSSITR